MVRPSSTLSEVRDSLVGRKVWLEYSDQNYKFEEAFTPQFCTIERQFADPSGDEWRDDWYLVALEEPVQYEGKAYDHLVISSKQVGYRVGGNEPTGVFVVLAPNPDMLTDPFKMDRSLYIAWGMAANTKADLDQSLRRSA